ncbi:hypothetical protein C1A50_4411 [Paenibacillus polymyxa]|nr:hypothetical protein C1A50_4411 [Paenibacillus polymyxa]
MRASLGAPASRLVSIYIPEEFAKIYPKKLGLTLLLYILN